MDDYMAGEPKNICQDIIKSPATHLQSEKTIEISCYIVIENVTAAW
jgi:hypothetical protein